MITFFAIALLALYHHFGEMYLNSREGRERQGPEVGKMLKRWTGLDIAGREWVLPARAPSLMLFVSVDCKLCGRLRNGIAAFATQHPDLAVTVLCDGQVSQVKSWAESLRGEVPVIADPLHRKATAYGVAMTPFVVGCDSDGVVVLRGLFNEIEGLELAAEQLERELLVRSRDAEAVHPLAPIGVSS